MALIEPDFSEVPNERSKIEPGIYKVRIVNDEVGQWPSKEEGKPPTIYVKWEMDIIGDEALKGRKLWTSTPATGRGAYKMKNLFKAAMGEEVDEKDPKFDTTMLHGKELEVTLTEGKPNAAGKVYTDISVFKPL